MWLLKGEKSVWAQLDLLLRASQAVIKLSTGRQDVFCTERFRKASSVKQSACWPDSVLCGCRTQVSLLAAIQSRVFASKFYLNSFFKF